MQIYWLQCVASVSLVVSVWLNTSNWRFFVVVVGVIGYPHTHAYVLSVPEIVASVLAFSVVGITWIQPLVHPISDVQYFGETVTLVKFVDKMGVEYFVTFFYSLSTHWTIMQTFCLSLTQGYLVVVVIKKWICIRYPIWCGGGAATVI